MRIALAQFPVSPANPVENTRCMLREIAARKKSCDLIVFPEMAVGGYLVGDRWLEPTYTDWLTSFNQKIAEAAQTHKVSVAFGNIWIPDSGVNQDGRRRQLNATFVFTPEGPAQPAGGRASRFLAGLPDGVAPKALLPNYRYFDDRRHFLSLEDLAKDAGVKLRRLLQPFLIPQKDGKPQPIGFFTCEDLWCEDYRRDGERENIAAHLIENGAKLLINLSASPWTLGKNAARDRQVKRVLQNTRATPLLYVNRTGAENCGDNILTYDGGTTAYNKNGEPVFLANNTFRKETCLLTWKRGKLRHPSSGKPLTAKTRPRENPTDQKIRAVLTGLAHTKQMAPLENWAIGLSGGLDSSVCAWFLTQAFGPKKVFGLTMPGPFTSKETLANAQATAKALGIELTTIPVGKLLAATEKTLYGNWKTFSLNKENILARLRGSTLLAGFAAKNGALYTNNGNKLETALGYATLYGDVNGAIAPLADLTKIEIVAIAREINRRTPGTVPHNLLPTDPHLWVFGPHGTPPSAELKAGQIDPMKFGYHDALLTAITDYKKASKETLMTWFLEGSLHTHLGIPVELLQRWGVHTAQAFLEDLDWFFLHFRNATFKRIQAPPIIVTSKTAFGEDLRESILRPREEGKEPALRKAIQAQKKYMACQNPDSNQRN